MKTLCFYPGQIRACRQSAGTQFIAVDGVLRLTYRDPSLDWLLNVTSPVAVNVGEGKCHVLPYDAWVEIEVIGTSVVHGLVSVHRPLRAFGMHIGKQGCGLCAMYARVLTDLANEERRA